MNRFLGWVRIGLLDLRGDLRRFGILIACLALGTAVIAAVGSVGAGLRDAVVRDATVLMGGDLEASRPDRDATPEELQVLETLGQVTHVVDTTARAAAGDFSTLVDIAAVGENYPLLGNVTSPQLRPGGKPWTILAPVDGVHGALVHPELLTALGLATGGRFSVGRTEFEVRGLVTGLPDGAVRGFRLGLLMVISDAAVATMTDLRPPLPGLLTQRRYKIQLDGQTYDEAKASIETAFNDRTWTVRSPRDAAGDLARYYDLFTRFLLIVGLSSLLVGGVGVFTGVTSYIGERQRSIATMRSMGATGARVLTHFLSQVAVLTFLGVGIGIIAGAISSAIALPFVGRALAVNLPSSIDVPALSIAAGFGILAGFAFSYLPLARARNISPAVLFRTLGTSLPKATAREIWHPSTSVPVALAVLGIYLLAVYSTRDVFLVTAYAVGVVVAFIVLRAAAWLLQSVLSRLPSVGPRNVRYALRNIYRPGSPATVVILSIGLGLSMLLVVALLNANLQNQLLGAVSRDAPTFVATDLFDDEIEMLREIQENEASLMRLEWSPSIRARVTRVKGVDASTIEDVGEQASFLLGPDIPVTWRAEPPIDGTIVEGEWWPADYAGPPLISLHTAMRRELGVEVGDIIEFDIFGDTIEARVANFRDFQWLIGLSFVVIFSPGEVSNYPATYLGSLKAAPGLEEDLERSLTRTFPEVAFIAIGDALRQAVGVLGQLATAVNIVGSLAVINGLLVLSGTMAAGRKQRESDAVVHKVLGATRGHVLWIFAIEYGVLAAYAALVATLIGAVAAWAITENALDVGFAADPGLIAIVVAGAIVVTVTAGAVTTWRSLSTPPAQYLRSAH